MQITIAAIGSRGDVQPYLALALGLKAAGHSVTLIAGENFRAWITGMGVDFAPTVDIEMLMNSPDGRKWVEQGHNTRTQFRQMRWITEQIAETATKTLIDTARSSDVMLTGLAAEAFLHAIREKYGTRLIAAALQPYQRSRSGAASLNIITPGTSRLNGWMGALVTRMLFGVYSPPLKKLRAQLDLPPLHFSEYLKARDATPYLYGVSRHVLPHPSDWSPQSHVTGYWFLDQPEYQPPQALIDFLSAGDPPVYVGFGSMSISDPQTTFELVTQALKRAGKRGVIITGWSGAKLESTDTLHILDQAPHSWLFPHMAAIVHHGGAGTTAAGLRAGKPSLIIPHLGDQPYWGRRVHELGVGAQPIPRQKLTVENLAAALTQMTTNRAMIERAARLGEQIRAEDGIGEAVRLIERYGQT